VIRRDVWEEGERVHPLTHGGFTDMVLFLRTAQLGWDFARVAMPLVVVGAGPDRVSVSPVAADMGVRSFAQFRFSLPAHECQRRRRLTASLHARSFSALREGDRSGATADLRRAASLGARGARHRALGLLTRWPALVPVADLLRTRLRRR
jgi:hypothetical protein